MLRHGPGLEHRQGLLGRLVDDGSDLLAMATTLARAASRGDGRSIELAAHFCQHARAREGARHALRSRVDRDGHALAHSLAREAAAGATPR
jgi:hypothetical protein